MGYRLQQQQRQKTSIKLVYASAGIATMFIAFGAVFMFNIGNVRSALAGYSTTYVWEGKSSSNWNDKNNWDGGKLPQNGDNIVITDKYKHAPVIADDSYFNIYDLNISKGAKLTIKANLEVKDDITIKGSKTQIIIDGGELVVNDHIYVVEKGELISENGIIQLKDDLSIDEGSFTQNGSKAKFETKDDIELLGDNSTAEINDGLVKVELDFDFESGSKKAKQRLEINGGKVYIEGETRFYKTQATDETDQLIEINGGYVEFNEIARLGNTGTTYPGNYIFHITGGETHFNEDLIMNQWKNNPDFSSGSSSSSSSSGLGKQIGEYNLCKVLNIKKWNSGKYKRKNTEQIFVEYNSKIYRMKTGVYWSKNHEPDKSKSYWEEYTCTDLCKVDETWDSGETYKRNNGGDEVYVIHQGVLYDMKQDVWWSKNHEPGSKDGKKYWTELETCFEWSEEKCGNTSMWNSSIEYKRSNSSDVIEVGYDGYVYSLKSNVWYSKNDNPSKSSKWTKEKACNGSSSSSSSSSSGLLSGKSISTMLTSLVTTGEDEFVHEDGKVVFHKNWKRPSGFETKGTGIVHFKNSGKMNLQKGEKYVNLVIDSGVELEMDGDIEVKGDITNYSSKTPTCNSKWITLSGTGNQTISGDYDLIFDNLKVNKTKGEIHLSQDLTINGKITFNSETAIVAKEKSGNKTTTYPVITFEDDATWEGDGWFEGKVRKNGDDAFTFPTGKAGRKGYISITAPSGVSTYDAEYFAESPESGSVGTGLKNVSTKEYWSLEKISGQTVGVTLHWADGAYSGITDETEILVTEWDGSKWQTLGRNDHTGDTESG
ncbi:MAG: hypothetical protein KDC92_13080, partial [Bacteroidetes bacterium]|nr:hypothetical protein [Bacteroidota bacterium]